MMKAQLVLLGSACALQLSPSVPGRTAIATRAKQPSMQLWAGKKRNRYEDDGSRLNGAEFGVDDEALSKGWFSNFKFGTEVEVVSTDKDYLLSKAKKVEKTKAVERMGDQAYFGSEVSQIRQRKLEAFLNSEEEATDGTFGKIMSGSALLAIFGGLVAVYFYYGGDGLMQATAGQRAIQETRRVDDRRVDVTCMTTECM